MNGPSTNGRASALLSRLLDGDRPGDRERGEAARHRYIDITRKDQSHVALDYAHLLWVTFNLSGVIVLHFSTHTVTLKGRNLEALYISFLRHDVTALVAIDERNDMGDGESPVVNFVHVMPKPGHEEPSVYGVEPEDDGPHESDEP